MCDQVSLSEELREAARDFKYLLDRGYNRKSALDLVSSKYLLTKEQRNVLQRSIFSEEESRARRRKIVKLRDVRNKRVVVDCYNVLITLESLLRGEGLVKGTDGFLRDVTAAHSGYEFKEPWGPAALELLFRLLESSKPSEVYFVLDSQLSKSGELAATIRKRFLEANLKGEVRVSKAADAEILALGGVVATTDSVIIDKVSCVLNIADEAKRWQRDLETPLKI